MKITEISKTQLPVRVKLNSNFQLDLSFDKNTILQLNSVELEFEDDGACSYRVYVTALGSDLEYNKSVASRNWKNLESENYELDIFEFYGIKPNGDFKTSIFVMDTDDCFDIITEYDEPKFSINDMLNTIKSIAPTFHLINKDNVETFVEELRTK